jgi:hypothetical protein
MGAPGSGRTASKNVMPFADDRPIWERQPHETDKAWQAFLVYRGLHGTKRTFDEAARVLNKPQVYRAQLRNWSALYGWRQRIVEFETHQDREKRRLELEEYARTQREMSLVATAMWKLAAKSLQRWHKKLDKAGEDETVLSPSDARALADAGMKLQQILAGQPDSIQEKRHEFTVDEERKALRSLLMDKDALAAMDMIAEKMDGVGNGNGSGNGVGLH